MKSIIDVFYIISVTLFVFFLLVLLVIGIYALRAKDIYNYINKGKIEIEKSVEYSKQRNFNEANIAAQNAEESFGIAQKKVESINNPLFKRIDYITSQIQDSQKLLITAEIISRGIRKGTKIGSELFSVLPKDQVKLSDEQRMETIRIIYESIPEINGIKSDIELAILTLDQVKFKYLFSSYKETIGDFKSILLDAKKTLDISLPLMHLISPITGYPDKSTYLVLMQNKDELRPSGGFIGTFGLLEVEAGKIIDFNTHDVYHLDMPVQEKINIHPPEPLKKYLGVDKWFFRDSNWSPDWPKTAQSIQDFFNREKNLLPEDNEIKKYPDNFTGVIAITPYFVTSLLDLTGPIIIEGQEYNENNFTDLLEYRVEKGYVNLGVPKWERKEIIGELVKEIKTRLFDKSGLDIFSVYKKISENILSKDVLIYFNNDNHQKLISDNKLSGEIVDTDGDYFMVVDANMASLKTDAVMDRELVYSVEEDNGLKARLDINYKNNGVFDWKTTRYRTYTRVYVPLGSELIKATGYSEDDLKIYNEDGKTVFAVFLSVEPGEEGKLSFEYKLPDSIYHLVDNGKYSLYAQKQPGNKYSKFNIELNFNNKIKTYNPTGINVDRRDDSSVSWKEIFNRDYLFQVNFK